MSRNYRVITYGYTLINFDSISNPDMIPYIDIFG